MFVRSNKCIEKRWRDVGDELADFRAASNAAKDGRWQLGSLIFAW
jgi:hypothetical protein